MRVSYLVAVALCLQLACAEEASSSAAPADLRIVCEGITTASLAGQDLLYSGKSEFDWDSLHIRVKGQLHVFCGVSLNRTDDGVRGRFEIQSLTGNGVITTSWNDGATERQLKGTRIVIQPRSGATGSGFVILDGLIDATGQPLPGKFSWDTTKHRWVAGAPGKTKEGEK